MDISNAGPGRAWLKWVSLALAFLVIGAGVTWAAMTVLTPPQDVLDSTTFTYVRVVDGEVGSSINLNTVAEWTPEPVGANLASGTVTTINVSQGQEVGPGTTLYTVNLRPVVIAQGDVPAFQTMSRGSTGLDIAQLQNMLTALGFYGYTVDGNFDWVTEQAVEAWQESLGLDPDGVVGQGDVVFVPNLPTRVALDTDVVKRGAFLGGGEDVVKGLPSTPSFSIPATATQAGLMPAGTRVEITGPGGEAWEGFVVDQTPSAKDDGVTLRVAGADGSSICADACASVPVTGEVLLRSRIVTVESVTGLTVPSAALLSKADGSLVVIDRDGDEHRVKVATSARGMSIIHGVVAGTMVRVPATEG